MASARRIPGEKLVARMSLRLAHASDLAAGGHLSQRLAQRSALRSDVAGSLVARLDRWERSPMIAWAGVLMGEAPSRPFAWSGMPQPVLAMPAEASQPSPGIPASRPRRGRAAVRGPASAASISAGRPAVFPQSNTLAAPTHRSPAGVLGRSSRRAQVPQAKVPLHSTWARRLLEPASTLVPAGVLRTAQASPVSSSDSRVGTGPAALRSTAPRRQASRAPSRPSPQRQLARPDAPDGPPAGEGSPQRRSGAARSPVPAESPTPSTSAPSSTAPSVPTPRSVPTPLEHLEQRQGRPVGVVASRLGSNAEPTHPAARGFDAVRAGADEPLPEQPSAASVVAFERHPARAMLHALARAGSPQEAARVVVESSAEMRAARDLPAPLAEVVQQIQQQVQHAAKKATLATPSGRVVAKAQGRAQAEAALPGAAARLGRGTESESGEVVSLATMRLLRRLGQLVHIAEADRRLLEAQRRVRMAEDSDHARAEAASASGTDSAGDAQPVDLDTLGREVLAAVTDKLATRNDRRPEDPDVPIDGF